MTKTADTKDLAFDALRHRLQDGQRALRAEYESHANPTRLL
ncbi:MAG: hypothetical protein H6R19_443, partial [Proteobacteria bacterium]|nr:hypothetical protein [Pseudomonadota bacterium]